MMFFQVNSTDSPRRAKKKWLEFCVSTGRMTEFIWQHMLAHLRAITPWKKPSPSNPIHTACEVPIPDCVQRVLSLGPKFATQPQLAPPEMLTLVRQVAKRAPEAETDRCVAEGIQDTRNAWPLGQQAAGAQENRITTGTSDPGQHGSRRRGSQNPSLELPVNELRFVPSTSGSIGRKLGTPGTALLEQKAADAQENTIMIGSSAPGPHENRTLGSRHPSFETPFTELRFKTLTHCGTVQVLGAASSLAVGHRLVLQSSPLMFFGSPQHSHRHQ
ncbi:hypothetical protein HPB50_025941 [Hyalomma asiaticum]|uniref:Uncharacterized protein n=1 Tax=Hyalomma asiaticum TaxID=266040 RepID=A0ACB7S271_HYAAI|nr:hypothetical protein HPB50_025941 [Hyalomma asiaticum]